MLLFRIAKFLQVQHADETFPFVSRLQTPVLITKQLRAAQVSWMVTSKWIHYRKRNSASLQSNCCRPGMLIWYEGKLEAYRLLGSAQTFGLLNTCHWVCAVLGTCWLQRGASVPPTLWEHQQSVHIGIGMSVWNQCWTKMERPRGTSSPHFVLFLTDSTTEGLKNLLGELLKVSYIVPSIDLTAGTQAKCCDRYLGKTFCFLGAPYACILQVRPCFWALDTFTDVQPDVLSSHKEISLRYKPRQCWHSLLHKQSQAL